MPNIHILIGNIATGKTTLAKKLSDAGCLPISLDFLRAMKTGTYVFDEELEPLLKECEERIIEAAMMRGMDIVVDDARFVLLSHRMYIYDLAREFDYDVFCHIMPKVSKEESVRRMVSNNFNENISPEKWGEVWEKFNMWYQEVGNEPCTIKEDKDVNV